MVAVVTVAITIGAAGTPGPDGVVTVVAVAAFVTVRAAPIAIVVHAGCTPCGGPVVLIGVAVVVAGRAPGAVVGVVSISV